MSKSVRERADLIAEQSKDGRAQPRGGALRLKRSHQVAKGCAS